MNMMKIKFRLNTKQKSPQAKLFIVTQVKNSKEILKYNGKWFIKKFALIQLINLKKIKIKNQGIKMINYKLVN